MRRATPSLRSTDGISHNPGRSGAVARRDAIRARNPHIPGAVDAPCAVLPYEPYGACEAVRGVPDAAAQGDIEGSSDLQVPDEAVGFVLGGWAESVEDLDELHIQSPQGSKSA